MKLTLNFYDKWNKLEVVSLDDWVNEALITKSLIYNASLIIKDKRYFTVDRFFDFSALCEAVVLFDELKTIESSSVYLEIPLSKIPLSEELFDNRVLSDLNLRFTKDEVKRILENMPHLTRNQIDNLRPIMGRKNNYRKKNGQEENDYINGNIFATNNMLKNNSIGRNVNFFEDSIDDSINTKQRYIHRAIGYSLIAQVNNIDYYPDFLRVPYVASNMDRIYKSVSKEIYQKISEILELDIKEINKQTKSTTFPIPPFTALALYEAKSYKDLPSVLLDIRNEFKSFRNKISKIDRDIKNSQSIEEKMKSLNKKKEFLEDISNHYKNPDIITFKEGLNYSMKLTSPLINPTDPTSYSSTLLSQPAKWIKKWWIRRPIASLYRVDKKIRNIHEYNNLVQSIWNKKIETTTENDYNSYGKTVEMMFDKY